MAINVLRGDTHPGKLINHGFAISNVCPAIFTTLPPTLAKQWIRYHNQIDYIKMKNYLLLVIIVFSFGCKKDGVTTTTPPVATVSALNCSAANADAIATAGLAYTATVSLPYTGGNGASYSTGSSVPSIGVAGLTAALQAGTLVNGSGNLTFRITGTPVSSGVASFTFTFQQQSCIFSLQVSENVPPQYGVPFANVPDRPDAIIYQVNTRAFSTPSNLAGVTARLDSIKALGVNVIYLMPIYPIGTLRAFHSPYAIKDYLSVGAEYGTLQDLRNLVDGAHNRSMAVILDWVANHTAWDHPWISLHSNWYMKDGSGTIISPPGMGWNDVAQLNFNNAAMRLEMIKSMKHWIRTANVDGFRFDYADGPPVDFWKQVVDTMRNLQGRKLILLAEGARSNHFTAGFDYTFGFGFYGNLKNVFNNQPATIIDNLNNSEYTNATNNQQVIRYITNHDVNGAEGTPQDLFGGTRGSMAAFVIAAYMKGVPMVYNGQEVGTPYRLSFPFTGADINWSLNADLKEEYKRILAIRNNSPAIRRGQLTSFTNTDVCAFTKEQGTEQVFVVVNVRNSNVTYTLPASVANATWTDMMTSTTVTTSTSITLSPYSYQVLKK